MQRELSSFDLYVIVSELQDLIGGYVDKIYQPTRDELLIRVKKSKTPQKEFLYARNPDLICRTYKEFKIPTKPTTFAMTLRKFILNGKITSIQQHEFDRILIIKIQKKEGKFHLIFELFKNGNIILTDPDKRIILPLISQRWAHRTIRPHKDYISPPSQTNPFSLSFEQFTTILTQSSSDLVRTLAVSLNLGGTYAEELCLRSQINKNIKTSELTQATMKQIYNELQAFLDVFTKKEFKPIYIKKDGAPIDIFPFSLQQFQDYEYEDINSFSLGLQEFITIEPAKKVEPTKIQKQIEKLERQLKQQTTSIDEFNDKIKQKQREGELLYLHFTELQEILDEIKLLLKQKDKEEGIEKINALPIVKEFDPAGKILIVSLSDNKEQKVQVNLDFRRSVAKNAEKAYNESKKFQEKIKGAQEAVNQTEKTLQSLKKKESLEETPKKAPKQEKQFWFENYRWTLSSEGNVIIGGKDAKTNERIVKKYLTEGDRYVHADIHGAPSCIVKNYDINESTIPISDQTLQEASIFAACYSKAWKQFGEAQVYWVLPEQVSKTPQSGEFVPKGAFIIRGKRTYYRCKLELAIGYVKLDATDKIMAGAEASLAKYSRQYVVLQPGSSKRDSLIHSLAHAFAVSPDVIMRLLPPGDAQIVKTIGVEVK